MERLNSKLYMENCYIIKENERLKRKAALLNHENQQLLTQLRQRLPSSCMGGSPATAPPPMLPDLNIPLADENHPAPAAAAGKP